MCVPAFVEQQDSGLDDQDDSRPTMAMGLAGGEEYAANCRCDTRRVSAFAEAAEVKDKPTVLIANTIKGKGVSFMENNPKYHGVAPTEKEMALALQEIG